MTENQLSLSPFYAGWDVYQQHLALRSSPQNWSIGMIATHIVAGRAWWFHTRMSEGSADLASLELWDLGICEGGEDPLHSAAELVAGLERTWQMIQNALAHLTPADLEQVFPHPDRAVLLRHAKLVEPALQQFAQAWLDTAHPAGGERPARSHQWIIWHVLEHDIHHGGELSSILGAHGLAAVDLG
jgi:hypothetical protein